MLAKAWIVIVGGIGLVCSTNNGALGASLSLHVETPKAEYAVGEPIKLRVTLRNDTMSTIRIADISRLGMNMEFMRYEVTKSSGDVEVCRSKFIQIIGVFEARYGGEPLGPQQEVVTFLYPVGVWRRPGADSRWRMRGALFPEPGEYRLRVTYVVPSGYVRLWQPPPGGAKSNEVMMRIRQADAIETEIFKACSPGASLSACLGELNAHATFDESSLRQVIQRYPDHPMIVYARYTLARSLTRIDQNGIGSSGREGMELFEQLREQMPGFRSEEIGKQMATAYFFLGNEEASVALFEETVTRHPYMRQEFSFMSRYIHALTGDSEAPARWQEARRQGKRGLEFLEE